MNDPEANNETEETAEEQDHLVQKEQFSKEIVTSEGYYVPEHEDVNNNEFEISHIDMNVEDQHHPEVEETGEKKVPGQLETGFFDVPAPEDQEKQKIVQEISGMSEREEDEVSKASDPAPEEHNKEEQSQAEKKTAPRDTIMDLAPDINTARASIRTAYSYAESKKRERISYAELGPRIRTVSEDDDLEGFDMGGGDVPILFDDIVEEEEQTIVEEEEEKSTLDRAPYYERHDKAVEEISQNKCKSFLLQKMLAMYFRRKKMDYVTKETDWSFDQQNKYFRKLDAYGELIKYAVEEKERLSTEITDIRKMRDDQFKSLTGMFKKMQTREGDVGYGLINTKTGNAIADKHVDRLLNRQSFQMSQVSSMRLTFIKLKQMVQEKQDAINDLDEIAPGFLLADYEQLKVMNQSYADKIEEKDEELSRLRSKCGSTIQILAHLREKSAALENDLADLIEERTETDWTYNDIRGNLNRTKQHRDGYRHEMNKIREESGLLTQPMLLKDMEQGLTEETTLSAELEHALKEYKKRAKQIQIIRKKIEETVEMRRIPGRSSSRIRASMIHTSTKPAGVSIYKHRPSLMMPIIESKFFDGLRAIKPTITYNRKR